MKKDGIPSKGKAYTSGEGKMGRKDHKISCKPSKTATLNSSFGLEAEP